MKNGTFDVWADGEADEVAFYGTAISDADIVEHHSIGRALAAEPLPDGPATPPVVEPPAAGAGPGGGVLDPGATPPPARPAGTASVRRGVLVVRGAARTANRLLARRSGARWIVTDAAAPLRAGSGCRRRGPRAVSCSRSRVRRIVLLGGGEPMADRPGASPPPWSAGPARTR